MRVDVCPAINNKFLYTEVNSVWQISNRLLLQVVITWEG